ncbi:hypothetical protein [Microbacterium sp. gxy059]|uniref:hypothetical protein n=1 Tax=Microbacterium sp. gxy059 TaxID=2957199 RepID=UPI003D97D58F
MRALRHQSVAIAQPADAVFRAALGTVQSAKGTTILAVHNEGRKLVAREKSMMSNPKLVQIWIEGDETSAELNVAVGSDPRSPKALLDGKANEKSLAKLVEAIQSGGAAPTPVANHYLVKKTEVPWTDPAEDPQIELDGTLLALYGR